VIIRILGEGQYEVADSALHELEALDDALLASCESGEQTAFEDALAGLLDRVRSIGTEVADDYLGPSALVLPGSGATLDEVRELLTEEGLIHG
jgi:hypothetical protein